MNAPIDTGGPAFPLAMPEAAKLAATCEDLANSRLDSAERVYQETLAKALSGMTLRDYFASRALPVAMGHELGPKGVYQHFCDIACEKVARNAYEMADAMLKARTA